MIVASIFTRLRLLCQQGFLSRRCARWQLEKGLTFHRQEMLLPYPIWIAAYAGLAKASHRGATLISVPCFSFAALRPKLRNHVEKDPALTP